MTPVLIAAGVVAFIVGWNYFAYRRSGRPLWNPLWIAFTLTADKALTSPKGRSQFLRGTYADGAVRPVGGAGSHLVAALAHADALIVVPEDTESVEPGAEVEVVLLG